MCLTLSWSKFFILILLGSLMLGTGLFSFKHRLAELRAWSTNCIVKQLFDNHVESLIVMDRSLELFHLPTTSSMKRLDFGVGRSDADEQRLANHLILRSLRQQIWTMISQFEPTSDVRELLGMVEVLRLVRMNIKLKEELVRVIRAQHGTIEIEVLLK
ncbi:hypothetical protein VKT23_018956 [Stygiomarasmius scandens]|uniref:Uncharacterized protein n=1 Tax=Marasmiellus scandens TaxID=2682957 RepID=A0ABR1IMR4_9AGAR